jgi:hypothetical protein
MKCVEIRPELFQTAVLEDPPGSQSVDFVDLAQALEIRSAIARTDPTAWVEKLKAEQPWLNHDDAVRMAFSLAVCDAQATAALFRKLADMDIVSLASHLHIPALVVLADEQRGSFLLGSERRGVELAMKRGVVVTLPAQHYVHLELEDHYFQVIDSWLGALIKADFR